MAVKKVANMDDDELMREWSKAAKEYETARARVKDFALEYEKREETRKATEKLESMSEPERAALMQVMKAEGIKSKESVNGG